MNKADLIEVLTGRLGDRKTASTALDAVISEIQNAVTKGDKVAITGFGVFEKRERGPRVARNPRTGEQVKVGKTSVPAFRPGTGFKDLVAAGRPAKAAKAAKAATAAPARKTATAAVKKTTARKAAPAKKSSRAATSPSGRSTTSRAASSRAASGRAASGRAASSRTSSSTRSRSR